MIRLIFVLVCTGCLVAAPYAFGAETLRWGGPRAMIAMSLGALVATASSLVVLLVSVIDPPDVPASGIPRVIGRCVEAAGEFFSHPVSHWPQILAVLALLGLAARFIYATTATLLDARRTRRHLARIGTASAGFTVVESEEPIAYTVGLRRRMVVVSSGMLAGLTGEERAAILAHERAHVRGRHTALLTVARIVGRAFRSLPPVRTATRHLVLGLEAAADDAAAREMGDPVPVARALVRLAERSAQGLPASALGASESDVVTRVRRLTRGDANSRRRRPLGVLVTAATILLVASLLVVLPATRETVSAAAQGREVHAMCHIPHPPGEPRDSRA